MLPWVLPVVAEVRSQLTELVRVHGPRGRPLLEVFVQTRCPALWGIVFSSSLT